MTDAVLLSYASVQLRARFENTRIQTLHLII